MNANVALQRFGRAMFNITHPMPKPRLEWVGFWSYSQESRENLNRVCSREERLLYYHFSFKLNSLNLNLKWYGAGQRFPR